MNLRNTVIFFASLFVFLFVVKIFDISYPVQITNTSKSTELSVVCEGKVEVVPDVAYVDLGITVNNAATVESAQSQIDKTNNAIIEAMTKLNIPKKNIKTSNYSIFPSYRYDEGADTITGYSGNVTITIKTNDIQSVSQIIESATAAGANQVQNTRFEVEDPGKYRAEARKKAIENAKKQAQELASSLGIKLGKVVNIVEYTPNSGVVPIYSRADTVGLGGAGGPSLEAGSQNITSVVTLYFEKK